MQPACQNRVRRRAAALVIALLGIAAFPLHSAEGAKPQIIVHHSVDLPPNFSTSTLRAIFSGRMQRWPNGTRIRAFVLPHDHPIHQNFCREVLRTFPYVLQQQWDQQTFTGSGSPPVEIATTYQLHKLVSSTPGAIGYGRQHSSSDSWIKFVGGESAQYTQGASTF